MRGRLGSGAAIAILAWLSGACGGSEFQAAQSDGSGGSAGAVSTGGSAGTVNAGGSSGSASGGSDGSGGSTSSGGSAGRGGSGGSDGGTGGSGGSESAGGTGNAGGDGAGGSNGGSAGVGGGSPAGGSAGASSGGSPAGGSAGTGGSGNTVRPLMIRDLMAMDAEKLEGFIGVDFRCLSLTVCGEGHNCIYFGENFGYVQSTENAYHDGLESDSPLAVRVRLAAGSNSICVKADITIPAGASIYIAYDDGQELNVFFPSFTGSTFTLYVASDGSTYYDAALTSLAQAAP